MARIYNTSFEQLALSAIFDNAVGSTASLDTIEHRTGLKSVKFHKTGAASGSKRNAETNTGLIVKRFAFKLSAAPDGGTQVILATVGPSQNFNIRVDTTGKLTAIFGSTGAQTYNAGASITFGVWYVIDYRVDFSGTTYVADWRVNGVVQTQVTRTLQTGGVIATYVYDQSGPNNIDFWVDDWSYSLTSADYPLADQTEGDSETLKANATATPTLKTETYTSAGFTDLVTLSATATPTLSKELQIRVETLLCAANAPPALASQLLSLVDVLKVNIAATPSLVDPTELLTATTAATPALQSEQYVGGGGGWGPANIWSGGGEMTVAINPANPLKMVVGGDTSGIKISSDGGQSWRMSNTSMRDTASYQIASLAYHPDGSKVWVLVGGSSSGGLLESSDDGLTWTDVSVSQANIFGCGNGKGDFPSNSHPRSVGRLICVDPDNSYIYVATYKHGVWRAQLGDINGTWTQIAMFESGGLFYYCRSLIFGETAIGDPDYDVLYVGCSDLPALSAQGFVTRITTPRGTAVRDALTAAPVNPNRLLAHHGRVLASATGGGDEGLFQLTGAKTAPTDTAWVKIWNVPNIAPGAYINSLVKVSDTVKLAGIDNPGSASFNAPVYRLTSSDNFATGGNLTPTPLPASAANVTDQIYGGHGHYHLYQTDGTRILGKNNFYVSDLAVTGTKFVATGPGVNISDDNGASWAAAVYGMLDIGGRKMRADPVLPSRVYMSNTDRQLYCSLDRFTASFTTSKPGAGSMGTDIDFDTWSKTAAAMAATGARVYFAVADRDSNINGEIWYTDDPFTGPWTLAISVPTARAIATTVIQDGSGQTVVLGFFHDTGTSSTSAGIYRKVGAALSTKVKAAGTSGLLQSDGKKSASTDWRPGHAVWYFDGHSGVWRSTDFGATWTLAFPETSSNDDTMGYVVCHPTDPSKVYVSTKTKVWLLSNALDVPANIVATDISGGIGAPGAIAATPDGTVVCAERATSGHAARLWTWQAGAEGTQIRADDAYYQALVGFAHDLSRSTDGQLYASTDGAGMGRTQVGGGVTEQSLSTRGNATPALISEVYVPAPAGLVETLVLPAVASGKIPSARVRQLVGFGNATPDTIANTVLKDTLVASRFTSPNVPGGFDLVGIRVEMDNPNAVDAPVKAVVYSAAGADPGSQASQGTTTEATVPAATIDPTWYEIAFASPRRLAAGTDYYLSLLVGEDARLYGGAPPNVHTVATPYEDPGSSSPGLAFWGTAKNEELGETEASVVAYESALGRLFAGVRLNRSAWQAGPLINQQLTVSFDKGRRFTYQMFKPDSVLPDTDTSATYWASIAAGHYDTLYNNFFDAVVANGRWTNDIPFTFCFHHEQYVTTEPPGGANAGTAAEYQAAHRHVWQLLQDGGYHVSLGGPLRMAFIPHFRQFYHDEVYGTATVATPATVAPYTFTKLNPGPEYYDILGADIYQSDAAINGISAVHPARDMWKPVHDACVVMGKPMMAGEIGVAASKGEAFIIAYLQELQDLLDGWGAGTGPGQILALLWTNRIASGGDYRFDSSPAVLQQYRTLANLPFYGATY